MCAFYTEGPDTFICFSLQDVLYTICNNCGPVQRIVIFRKNGVQSMVEYPLECFLSIV